jgi:hypothetical protein
LLEEDGTAVFLETMATNPLLALARRHLVGRFGIQRLGTADEHPLTYDDLRTLEKAFGQVSVEVAEFQFLRILNRQVFRFRFPTLTKWAGRTDDWLYKRFRRPGC